MPNLPAIVRPMFPRLAHRLEFGKQHLQERDQDSLLVPGGKTLDVERANRGVDRSERQLALEVGRLQGREEVRERAYQELSHARDREAAIYERILERKHETHLAYMKRGNKAMKRGYKMKRTAIKYGCIALAAVVFAIWVDHKLFSPDLAPSKPLPHYQSAVDR